MAQSGVRHRRSHERDAQDITHDLMRLMGRVVDWSLMFSQIESDLIDDR